MAVFGLTPPFSDRLVNDDRIPFYIFEFGGETYGLLAPKVTFWVDTFCILILQVTMLSLYLLVIWYGMIQRRQSMYLLGYGVLIPSVWLVPGVWIDALRLENVAARVCFGHFATNATFACLAAMHGTERPSSLVSYLRTVTAVAKPRAEQPLTWSEIQHNLIETSFQFLTLSLFQSWMMHHHYEPFSSFMLANNYLVVLLACWTISLGLRLATVLNHTRGLSTKPSFRNPLFASASPSDFWGRRWNVDAHQWFKVAIYVPLRRAHVPKTAATALVFVASGILHDLICCFIFYRQPNGTKQQQQQQQQQHVWFKQTAFFVYCGVMVGLEKPVGRLLGGVTSVLPRFIQSTLVVMTVLPVVHWFTGDWTAPGGYFDHFSIALLRIVKLS